MAERDRIGSREHPQHFPQLCSAHPTQGQLPPLRGSQFAEVTVILQTAAKGVSSCREPWRHKNAPRFCMRVLRSSFHHKESHERNSGYLKDVVYLLRAISHPNFIGRMISNSAQWVMIVWTANADIVISPTVMVAMGTIVFLFSTLDAAIEYWDPRGRIDRAPEPV
jgi:hypothetical protein